MHDPPGRAASCNSAALDHVAEIVAKCRQDCDALLRPAAPRPIRAVGIVGAGIMGAAIAREHAAHGFPVELCDNDPAALDRAARTFDRRSSVTGMGCVNGDSNGSIRFTQSLADLNGCDFVLESIAEKRFAKESLYRELAPQLSPGSLVATNTSAIPISRLAAGIAAPALFCGMHFCHPVRVRPLVEIIAGKDTSAGTVAALVAHALSLGKLPLVVQDGPGFVVNRLLNAYLIAALDLLVGGFSPHEIDARMTGFGMPLGPLAQLDEIGLDTALASGVVMSEATEQRSAGTRLLLALSKAKQFGRKSGAGIYRYPDQSPNPSLEVYIKLACEETHGEFADAELRHAMLLSGMVSESERLIAQKKVAWSWQIDLATVFGLGFPCWRGGLDWWASHGS